VGFEVAGEGAAPHPPTPLSTLNLITEYRTDSGTNEIVEICYIARSVLVRAWMQAKGQKDGQRISKT